MWKGYHPIIFCVWKECEIHLLMLFTDKKVLISISYFPFLNVTQSPTQVMFLSYITALTLIKYFYRKKEEMWKNQCLFINENLRYAKAMWKNMNNQLWNTF